MDENSPKHHKGRKAANYFSLNDGHVQGIMLILALKVIRLEVKVETIMNIIYLYHMHVIFVYQKI